MITSSTLLVFFPAPSSHIWNFVSFSPLLLSLSSSVFLSSQANYNKSEGKSFFHSFILYSLSLFLSPSHSFFLKNISGQPETALHEEIFSHRNFSDAVQEVRSKNIISGFLCLKNRFKERFSANPIGLHTSVCVSKPC